MHLKKMKAVVYNRYGSPEVLKLQDVKKPIPKSDEVLIRVHATSVTAGDWRLRKADPFLARVFNGLFRPKRINILGFEISGVIEEVGTKVTTFKCGEAVFAYCGLNFGGYAEYCCLKESGIILPKPTRLTFTEAATIPLGSLTAWYFLKKAEVTPEQNVLIYGASGSVGTYAVQIAKYMNAKITAVCSTNNITLVKSLGADHTIDYTKSSFTTLDQQFDVVFDTVAKMKNSDCKRLLKPNGRYVSTYGRTNFTTQDLQFISVLIDAGKLTPVIDRVYTLDTIVEAHAYVEQFRKKGNVAIQVLHK
jgi:NADPH:quinone reductase-like Zn-dependent oxidoreductase